MVNLSIIRKPSPRYANNISVNEDVGDFLESYEEPWDTLSTKLHKVADFVRPDDFGKSTILGKNANFMKPFREALDTYSVLYDSSDWCVDDGDMGSLVDLENNPFKLRGQGSLSDPSFSERVYMQDGSKIIVIGDLHSGLHSLVQIIDDLVYRGILSNDLELKKGYFIVMLGDLLDRGGLGLEIIHIVFRIKVINFHNMIIINGNHEDVSMYSRGGFSDELNSQIDSDDDKNIISSVLTHLPSVVFAYINETNEWLQFNHGGIESTYDPIDFIESSYDYHFHGFDDGHDLKHMGLRWNDFNGDIDGIGPSSRGSNVYQYGKLATEDYLKRNNLAGIVRGHQELTHFMAMKRCTGSSRDLERFHKVGMYHIPSNHWKKVNEKGWETINMVNAFDDISVVTSSTANRARDLGMNVYMELTNPVTDFKDAQDVMRSRMNEFEEFAKDLELLDELKFMINSNIGSTMRLTPDKLLNWNYMIKFMKDSQDDYAYNFYEWFLLNSYGLFM